jgi:formate hydrogenlyase transcriptional activator
MTGKKDLDRLDESRYLALIGISTAIASQPDLQAALHSISALLSKVIPFDSIALLLLNQHKQTTQLYALGPGVQNPVTEIGIEVPFKNTVLAEALENQQPVFVPDVRQEMLKVPQFAEHIRFEGIQNAYVFPISSSRRKLGALIFGAVGREHFNSADIELMGSVAAHVSVALESALALEAAEVYRRELELERQALEDERDRLKLLLNINNHTVTHLEVNELFRAASISIRELFKNAFAGFWLFGETSNQLQCITFDFPESRGFVENIPPPKLTERDLESMRTRVPTVFGAREIESWSEFVAQSFRSESIVSIATVPLMGSTNPLGMIVLGSQQKDAFSQPNLDLLGQVSNQISLALENALAYGRLNVSHDRLEDERLYLESEIQSEYNFEDIVGKSFSLRKALEQVSIVAPTDSTVLLVGETGTGKELIARAIHNLSSRRERTFVRLNCAAIPSGLMESELFGYEKGAFTGALTQKRGRIELAHEGSLFLDEVGDIDPALQPKLLRVLQEREFERLGSNRTVKVNVRLIAATHRDLLDMVHEGAFREDLYYRLNVFPIHIPPLRERKEDIPLLVHHFISQLSRKMRRSIRIIPREAMEAMMNWSWPGNVRELQNFIERSVILSRDETLAAPISELKRSAPEKSSPGIVLNGGEREAIVQALRAAGGKISGPDGAAARLGMKRTSLQRKIDQLNISKEYF